MKWNLKIPAIAVLLLMTVYSCKKKDNSLPLQGYMSKMSGTRTWTGYYTSININHPAYDTAYNVTTTTAIAVINDSTIIFLADTLVLDANSGITSLIFNSNAGSAQIVYYTGTNSMDYSSSTTTTTIEGPVLNQESLSTP